MKRKRQRGTDHPQKNPPLPQNRRRGESKERRSPDPVPGDPMDKSPKKKRILYNIARVLLAAIITGATVLAGFAVFRHATTSDYFAVRDFEVEGEHRVSKAEVLKAAGLCVETNIFGIDLEAARSRLQEHSWIAEATVRRHLPRSVEISITERHAVATVFFDVPYLVDDVGDVFKRWVPGDPVPAPVLTGLSREQFVDDPDSVQETIRDAINLARRYRASGLDRNARLAEIHYEVDGGFSLSIRQGSFYVRFGRGPYRKKIRRLATLLGRLRRDGNRPAVIFFDNEIRPDRVTVKLKPRGTPGNEEGKGKKVSFENMKKRMSKI